MTYPFEIISSMECWQVNEKQKLYIHPREGCSGHCAFHHPGDHSMRGWMLYWRDDWSPGFLERICPDNGIGHPDPDQVAYWDAKGLDGHRVHGCDGCCVVTP